MFFRSRWRIQVHDIKNIKTAVHQLFSTSIPNVKSKMVSHTNYCLGLLNIDVVHMAYIVLGHLH